ncbi:hypothetical protein HYY69_06325 [Candidatus Woesearchaeota archaeon]|nr:hypothetical protein [Candidatus Woesearchaeota archaeon]
MMELGGNIKLDGFSDLKPADLVIAKKLIGNHVKEICDAHQDFKDITVSLKPLDNKSYELQTLLLLDKEYKSNAVEPNLYFALDKAFKALHQQIR